MNKLKSCPFCGADKNNGVRVFEIRHYSAYCYHIVYKAVCRKCGAGSKEFKAKTEAVNAWNNGQIISGYKE